MRLRLKTSGKWFLLSVLVGAVAGLGAVVFQYCSQGVAAVALQLLAGFPEAGADGEHHFFHVESAAFTPWVLLAVLGTGGLLSGFLVYHFAPEAEGHGTDSAIEAFHHKRGRIPLRVAIVKTLASAITLGTAGSGGREGPIAQIGAAFGSWVGQTLGLPARDRRILLAAGMGAGVGAIFRAPLAGALFAGEILYRDEDLESDVIVPSAIASIISYSVYGLFLPREMCFAHVFGGLSNYAMSSVWELLPLTILAVALVLSGVAYIQCFYGTHTLFSRLRILPHLKPAVGALLAGIAGLALFYSFGENQQVLAVLSTGYGELQTALRSPTKIATGVLLTIAAFKIVTTSLTISSGGSGGVFGPSMVIGGCLGVAIGRLLEPAFPGLVDVGAFGVVGMAGFFAGCARAPISTIIMVSEMTGSYQLLLPTMWVSTLCFLLCQKWTLYRKQLHSRLESPAHRGDFLVDVLEGIKVDGVFNPDRKVTTVQEAITLADITTLLSKTHQHYFPVMNDAGKMVGIFSADDVRAYLYDQTIWQLADAADVMTSRFLFVCPDDDLNTALRKFTSLNIDEIPVMDPADHTRFLGMLRRKETIACYNRTLLELKQAAEKESV